MEDLAYIYVLAEESIQVRQLQLLNDRSPLSHTAIEADRSIESAIQSPVMDEPSQPEHEYAYPVFYL